MQHDKLKDDLLPELEHPDEIDAYFKEIKKPEDFFSSKEGEAFYDAILMHLQVTGEPLKRNYFEHKTAFKNHDDVKINGHQHI